MRRGLAAVLAALWLSSAALAQAPGPDPVMSNYHLYRVAMASRDYAAAETAAAAALDASETRDGDGGHTAVLAENLAVVCLYRGEPAEAYGPALRAYQLNQAHPDDGVDPVMARLTLGEAALVGHGGDAKVMLVPALTAASGRADLDERAFSAATALGRWAIEQRDYDTARNAWDAALAHLDGATVPHDQADAIVRIGQGATIILIDHGHGSAEQMLNAAALLLRAERDLWPVVLAGPSDDQLTPAQTAFAQALAWRALAWDERRSHTPSDDEVQNLVGGVECKYDMHMTNSDLSHFYPSTAIRDGTQGVVVVRVSFSEQGQLTSTQIAAAAPENVFGAAATRIAQLFQFIRSPDSPTDCVMPRMRFIPIAFRM